MIELVALIILFWIPILVSLLKIVFWDLYFWQIKEYRRDRFLTHIRWDQDDMHRDYLRLSIKFIVFAITISLFEYPILGLIGIVLAYTIWTFEAFDFVSRLLNNQVIKPALKHFRNLLILFFLFLSIFIFIAFISAPFIAIDRTTIESTGSVSDFIETTINSNGTVMLEGVIPDIFLLFGIFTLFGLFLDLAMPFIVAFFVALTAPFSSIRRKLHIRKGINHFRKYRNNLKVIGITGSQGKTTTKELLDEILSQYFETAKTVENMNTKFGIASAVMRKISKTTEVFIAEIGAYTKGEIKSVVKDFPTNISIITDIDTQHMGLFGSQEKLVQAKSEIINLYTGVAILNGDNKFCRDIAKNLDVDKVYLTFSKDFNKDELANLDNAKVEIISAENIKKAKDGKTNFDIKFMGESYSISINLDGKDFIIDTVLISIVTAFELGIEISEIIKKLEQINFKTPRLTFESGDNDTYIFDDTYSSSRKGFMAAIDTINDFKKTNKNANNRILVTKGIFELGKEKEHIYQELVEFMQGKVDTVITTDFLLYRMFLENNSSINIIRVKSIDDMIYELRRNASSGDIILLEGRLHPKLIKEIVSDKH